MDPALPPPASTRPPGSGTQPPAGRSPLHFRTTSRSTGWPSAPTAEASSRARRDQAVRVWDAVSGVAVCSAPPTSRRRSCGVAFTPDGRRVVTVAAKNEVRFWEVPSAKVLHASRPEGYLGASPASISPDARFSLYRPLAGSEPSGSRIWRPWTTGGAEPGSRRPSSGTPSFSPDGRRVVTASDDKTATDLGHGHRRADLTPPFRTPTRSPSRGGARTASRVITVSKDEARVWDASTGKPGVAAP